MLPSEQLELDIYRFAESGGRARWRPAELGQIAHAINCGEHALLVNALRDLHARGFVELRRWSYERNQWVMYDRGDRDFFSRAFENSRDVRWTEAF